MTTPDSSDNNQPKQTEAAENNQGEPTSEINLSTPWGNSNYMSVRLPKESNSIEGPITLIRGNNADSSQPENGEEAENNQGEISLSTPWGGENTGRIITNNFYGNPSLEGASTFIKERTQLHQIYIQEEAKTKRLWLILSVVSLLVALTLMVFAPEGRQTLSYWVGGALLIFAAGAAGYKRVWGKSSIFSVGADQDKEEIF